MRQYCLIVKTGDAEIRALENIPQSRISKIFPVIELTRGRKITKDNQASYPFNKRIEKLKSIFKGQDVCIDVTSEESLSSPETMSLFNPRNGYENWVDFLCNLKDERCFNKITPTVLWNFDDPDYEQNISKQISTLLANFKEIAYRNSISDEGLYDDMTEFLYDKSTVFILDCGYIPMASWENVAEKCKTRLSYTKKILKNATHYVLASTSYPNNIGEFGDNEHDTLSLGEIFLYEKVSQSFPDLIYGDYGTINPIRNDQVVMARGWIPKIDVPLERTLFYHRKRRPKGESAYSNTYIKVGKACIEDKQFPEDNIVKDIWGLRQIKLCSQGSVPSSTPSFWISVRMNIHIQQQLISRLL